MLNDYTKGLHYAEAVVAGEIVAGKWVKLVCKQFLSELDDDSFGYVFDKDAAQHVCSFYEHAIKHTKGDLVGQAYELSGWETFCLLNIYGWKHRTDLSKRRILEAFLQVGRKNSKSTFSAGLPLYEMLFGGEGLEIYSVATKRDQAKIVWDNTARMITKSPESVKSKIKKTVYDISYPDKFNIYKTLGRDSNTLDGLNPSLCVFDEAAAITDRNVVEVITSATGARKNSLMLYITTAQPNKETIYYENITLAKMALDGTIEDPHTFAFICEPDEGDDWRSDEAIMKANPNLGRSVHLEDLRIKRTKAEASPSARANFKIKHLNLFVSSSNSWLNSEDWSKSEVDTLDTSGDLWVGVDLAATSDLTALGFLFRNGDNYHFDYKCFLPESAIEEAPKHIKPIYMKAIEAGQLVVTEGNATDYNVVKEYLQTYTSDKNLKEISYDPWSAQKFATELLAEGAPLVEVNQGMRSLSPATKDTEIHIRLGEILHLADPFLQWQFDNCELYTDVNGNIKVKKGDDSTMKIDAIISLILAVSRASSNGGLKKRTFYVYT